VDDHQSKAQARSAKLQQRIECLQILICRRPSVQFLKITWQNVFKKQIIG